MTALQHMADGAYAIRWVLVFLLVLGLVVWIGVLAGQRDAAEDRGDRLQEQLDAERAWTAHLENEAASDRAHIVALPPRQEATR